MPDFFHTTGNVLLDRSILDRESASEPFSLGSEMCRLDHFLRPDYAWWCARLKESPHFHRKQWEWVYICTALHERGKLRAGQRGLGFGVGQEPLTDLFASCGVAVVATDQGEAEAHAAGWTRTNEHAGRRDSLALRAITPRIDFEHLVGFQSVDMNSIPSYLRDFDFCWSACCLEHLGSLAAGAAFIESSLETLRPGGVAVHTTEYNLSSNGSTVEHSDLSIYRKRDLVALAETLRASGHSVSPLNFYSGSHAFENYVDLPPYAGSLHLRLQLEQYVCTSFGIIVTRGGV